VGSRKGEGDIRVEFGWITERDQMTGVLVILIGCSLRRSSPLRSLSHVLMGEAR
jgi:hypothetical protein